MTNIYSILSRIQKELKAPKNRTNSFAKYNYRNCEDILIALKLILPDDVCVVLNDELIQVGDRFYIKATASLCIEGQQISATGWAREALDKKGSDQSQITGATSSYARKYALNALFAIDDDDSDGVPLPSEPIKKPQNNASQNNFPRHSELTDVHIAVTDMIAENNIRGAANLIKSLNDSDKKRFWTLCTSQEKALINDMKTQGLL